MKTMTIIDSEFEDMMAYIKFLEDKFGNHWEEFVQVEHSVREASDEQAKHWEASE
tara:strand:+ start:4878 stop:5042 length:165 start_codon:yes stop_codon:yes gene_type:complete